MAKQIKAHYGSWKSPIVSDLIVSKTTRLLEPTIIGDELYWLEMRPEEQGRYVLVRRDIDGKSYDAIPSNFNARSLVHEYGGGSYVSEFGIVFFINFSDQRIYCIDEDKEIRAVTPPTAYRYADLIIDSKNNQLICVREDHTCMKREPVNTLAKVSLHDAADNQISILTQGSDFYSSPRLSPNCTKLAWISWNHPNMPWDGSELWVAELKADATLGEPTLIAGGTSESILQPEWSPNGTLYFISDRSGWWNLYRWCHNHVESVVTMQAEFGAPPWMFGYSTYSFESVNRIICTYQMTGINRLASIDPSTGRLDEIETPFSSISYLRSAAGKTIFVGATPTEFASIIELDLNTFKHTVLRSSSSAHIEAGYVSIPKEIEFSTKNNLESYAFFYPPKNQDYNVFRDERPPLLVISHGGPTAASDIALKLEIQYWTSRGIAILDVNYGGSSGYGREYRKRLEFNWGTVDVNDCINGTLYLIENNLVDKDRIAIRGGSAGGFTTLTALARSNVFKAGASYYGVSDLESLAKETHKFESRYLERLIGPYPQRRDLYQNLSPINNLDDFSCPIIFFQGLEDEIVPPNQTLKMVEALHSRGIPVAYLCFQGEQHGFRSAENIKKALEAELYFYSRVFGLDLAESLPSIDIENL